MDINSTSAASKKAGGFKNKKAKAPKHRPEHDEIDNIVTTQLTNRADKTKEINEVIANWSNHPFHFEGGSQGKSFIIQNVSVSNKEKSLSELSTKKYNVQMISAGGQIAKIVGPFI